MLTVIESVKYDRENAFISTILGPQSPLLHLTCYYNKSTGVICVILQETECSTDITSHKCNRTNIKVREENVGSSFNYQGYR